MSASRDSGTVVDYNTKGGYGFIEVDGTGEELFVHINSVKNPDDCDDSDEENCLYEGSKVEFSIRDPKNDKKDKREAHEVVVTHSESPDAIGWRKALAGEDPDSD